MADSLHFHPEVASDVRAAVAWYTHVSPDLANRFRDAVDQALDRILANPEVFAVAFDDARFTRVREFPYLIQFRIRGGTCVVLGVFHGASDPSTWRQRAK
jgi:plasmid stabilization system protein ParE